MTGTVGKDACDSEPMAAGAASNAPDATPLHLRLCRALLNLAEGARARHDASINEIADLIVQDAKQLVDDAQCIVSVVSEQNPEYFTVIAGSGEWAERKVGGRWPIEGTLNGRALITQQTLETNDAAGDSAMPEVFEDQIRVGRLVPILGSHPLPDGRTVLGVLGFWRSYGPFTSEEREVIDAFSAYAALHVVGLEARRVSLMTSDRLSFAHSVSLDLQSSLAPQEIIQRLLKTTLSLVQANRATLSTVDEDIITIEATLGDGGDPTWVGRTYGSEFFENQPDVRKAVTERRPVLGGALNAEDAAPEFRAALADTKYTLTLPLVIADKVVGLLVLSRTEDVSFTEADLDLMRLVGGIAALALRNARHFEEIDQAAQAKTDFLNMAAHELRTPVTVVQGYLDLMRLGAFGEIPEIVRRPVDLVAEKAAELGLLVNNILDAARLQPAPPTLPATIFDVRDEIKQALARAEARRELLGGTLQYDEPDVSFRVEARREYVGKVLDNLINNALAFQADRPWVRVILAVNEFVTVAIEDKGLGIPVEMQDHVFDQFFRVDRPPWNQMAGTGLGLYLGKKYARAAGGDLQLQESVPGKGTTFVLFLPCATS